MAKARTPKSTTGITRRGFIKSATAGGAVVPAVGSRTRAAGKAGGPKAYGPKRVRINLTVNGKPRALFIEPRVTLLRALRNHLDLTGTKAICEGGACGGCSVLVDGVAVNACMTLALDVLGKSVTTIEGLASGDTLHPIQEEFCRADALQCGFCTPGMIIATKALLDRNKNPSLPQIREGLAGNICRCGTYNRIFAAVQAAAKRV